VLLVMVGQGLAPAAGAAPPARVAVFLTMLAGPSGAALLVTGWREGIAGIARLGQRLRQGPPAPRWYLLPLLAPLLLLVLLLALSIRWPQFRPAPLAGAAVPGLLGFAAIAGLGAGFFEELGWTGFATPRLLARHGVLRAGLTLGVPWALWHALPDFWGGARSFGSLWPLHFLQWVIALSAFRVVMTWVYARTGSLPLGMLMHAGFTGGQALLWPPAPSPGQGMIWYGAFAGLLGLLALIALTRRPEPGPAHAPGSPPAGPRGPSARRPAAPAFPALTPPRRR
jgi:membrane protease YdiL (CAAX protease family)